MTTTADSIRWCGTRDPVAFSRWVADRAAGVGPHLVPVTRVGRCPRGHLAAEVLRPSARPLEDALDALGVPTEGVAVTLTVPLLELAARARSGAVELGVVPFGAVRVDEAGAIIVADDPPGAAPACSEGGVDAPDPGDPSPPDLDRDRSPSPRRSTSVDLDGARQLVTAARAVWDRVDARSGARHTLDPVLDAARSGDAGMISEALDLVVGAAPPRPVRWSRPASVFLDEDPGADRPAPVAAGDVVGTVAEVVRDVVERGVPLGRGRRVPVRHVVVGAVVTGGLVTAMTSLL
ncbi:hypothetical protein L2091_09530 [Curtobacterium albidum]|uniref:hypothetical protein n=1 Tax=Curtobacterium citreum TaxID=2036 RepID=UPI002025C62E|nr:hypothetical protein [Curtobacterium albidum]MCL9665467.1 hypothetical protein [Curtobacterium albidum]